MTNMPLAGSPGRLSCSAVILLDFTVKVVQPALPALLARPRRRGRSCASWRAMMGVPHHVAAGWQKRSSASCTMAGHAGVVALDFAAGVAQQQGRGGPVAAEIFHPSKPSSSATATWRPASNWATLPASRRWSVGCSSNSLRRAKAQQALRDEG